MMRLCNFSGSVRWPLLTIQIYSYPVWESLYYDATMQLFRERPLATFNNTNIFYTSINA